jgi:aspartate aminotransferase/aminotransferase
VSIAPTKLRSEEFAMRLLLEEHISVVPGIGYGDSCDSFVRVSVGTESIEDVKRGLLKMKQFIEATS